MVDAAIDAPKFGCPATYITVNGESSQYRFLPGPLAWKGSEQRCELEDLVHPILHLAVPNNADELADLYTVVQAASPGFVGFVWIGVAANTNTAQKSDFFAINNEPVPDLWAQTEPHIDAAAHGVHIGPAAPNGMGNEDSNNMHALICECDQLAPSHLIGF
jgi:hypothetical protein